MRKSLLLLPMCFMLAACGVDTTGVQTVSTKEAKGNLSNTVTLTEWGDLQCPACRSAEYAIVEPTLQKYGNKINFEFKQFPIQSLHPFALPAAVASECAADQGKFWEYHDLAYKNQDKLSTASIRDWAVQLNLNMDLFDRCTKSNIKKRIVIDEYDAGIKAGVKGTPTFFLNGKPIQTDSDTMDQAIEDALKQGEMQL